MPPLSKEQLAQLDEALRLIPRRCDGGCGEAFFLLADTESGELCWRCYRRLGFPTVRRPDKTTVVEREQALWGKRAPNMRAGI